METVPSTSTAKTAPRRLPLFLFGFLLFVLGPIIYAFQFSAGVLTVPWYVPILGTVGVLLMLASIVRRPGVVRIALFVLFLLVCGFEWFFILFGANTPPYRGPAQAGRQLPAFTTTLWDGSSFSDKNLAEGKSTVLVFFRGRW
jgi:hypothetical protein